MFLYLRHTIYTGKKKLIARHFKNMRAPGQKIAIKK